VQHVDDVVAALEVEPRVDRAGLDARPHAPPVVIPLEDLVVRQDAHTLRDHAEPGAEPPDAQSQAAAHLGRQRREDFREPLALGLVVREHEDRPVRRRLGKLFAHRLGLAAHRRRGLGPKQKRIARATGGEARKVEPHEVPRPPHDRVERVHAHGAGQPRDERAADLGDLERILPDDPGVARQVIHEVRRGLGRDGTALARREERDRGTLAVVEAPLRRWVERAQALERVAEELQPIRHRRRGGEDVDDAAAHRVLAGLEDEFRRPETPLRQPLAQPRQAVLLPHHEFERVLVKMPRRRHRLHQRHDRRNEDARRGVCLGLHTELRGEAPGTAGG
jgi:hypothetical protein